MPLAPKFSKSVKMGINFIFFKKIVMGIKKRKILSGVQIPRQKVKNAVIKRLWVKNFLK